MDHTLDDAATTNFEEEAVMAKQRFESFKLGKTFPSMPPALSRPQSKHGRSHSRNTSVSSISSLSNFSSSTSLNFISSTNDMPSPFPPSAPSKRPNSHHRRRSSVSTRRESAELMGVSLPDLPPSISEDNINLGDKDSIRRRALWALEGKGDVAFSKVEIPEFDTSERKFDFPSKLSFSAGTPNFTSNLMGKRDSFGKLLVPSSSSKDQLHTLVEEEEEEEDQDTADHQTSSDVCITQTIPSPATCAQPLPTRPRPASLTLRPLSLTPDALISSASGSLPTPTLTPNTRSSGLKSLALVASPFQPLPSTGRNRHSLVLTPSSIPPSGFHTQRPSLTTSFDKEGNRSKRPSSISYRSSTDSNYSYTGLPTPEMTPTNAERPRSMASSDDDLSHHRPLSASEQHFLFKSHNALLGRITDLERALSMQSRSRSRPVSYASSEVSSVAASEPTDEMLQLMADLKAERDELKRDVDGWRTRVNDLEKQLGVFAKRVEIERREAWVARSRVGVLEVEKDGLENTLQEKSAEARSAVEQCDALKVDLDDLTREVERWRFQVMQGQQAEDECARLRVALEEERQKREELERLLATPKPDFGPVSTRTVRRHGGLGFPSADSEITDVESFDGNIVKNGFPLKAVAEEDEDEDEDNGLAGYEDEEDSDASFQSPGGSSFGSEEFSRFDTPSLVVSPPTRESSLSLSPSPSPTPAFPSKTSHGPHGSLSNWTFPKAISQPSIRGHDEIDRFFGCLDDIDSSPVDSFAFEGKEPFSRALMFGSGDEEEDLPPFVIPSDVGVEARGPSRTLDIVMEEDEEEEELFGTELQGGITFTITPADEPAPSRKPSPIPEPVKDVERKQVPCTPPPLREQTATTVSSDNIFSPRGITSPSSIPRSTALKSFGPLTSTPPRLSSARFSPGNAFVTPPTKRGGTMPSFIPQPVCSPLKNFTSTKQRSATSSPLVRQQSKSNPVSVSLNGSTAKPRTTAFINHPTARLPTTRRVACH